MSKEVRIHWNRAGMQTLLSGRGTGSMVARATSQIQANAGEDFDQRVRTGTRVRGYVVAGSPKARRKQAKDPVLQRAVGRTVL